MRALERFVFFNSPIDENIVVDQILTSELIILKSNKKEMTADLWSYTTYLVMERDICTFFCATLT